MSEHWYDSVTGEPMYTVPYANPSRGYRDTTLGDAKKMRLFPSVSGIISVLDKRALNTYKQDMLLKAFMQHPYDPANELMWAKRVITEAKREANESAERGDRLHNTLEEYYKTGRVDDAYKEYVVPVIEFMASEFPNAIWISEKTFASKEGFGGKVDLHSVNENIVLDFKTKNKTEASDMKAYDMHHMQTAAYAMGLGMPTARRYNLFLSNIKPGVITLTESVDFKREWGMFYQLLKYWQLANRYEINGD